MTKAHRGLLGAAVVAVGVMIGAGTAVAGPARVTIGDGDLVPNPAFVTGPVAGTDVDDPANPASGAEARVHVVVGTGGGTNATLRVSGLPANRTFGAHLHRDVCTASFGGPHYQHPSGTPVAGVTPSPLNEVWLDVTTNPAGRASSAVKVPFEVLSGMRSVVVHQLPTNGAGAAGQRLGCLPLDI